MKCCWPTSLCRPRASRTLALSAASVLLLMGASSCGGAPTQEEPPVRSDDGSAEVKLSEGSLANGLKAKDIKLIRLAADAAPATVNGLAPAVSYQLEPAGAQFKAAFVVNLAGINSSGTWVNAFLLSGDDAITALDVQAKPGDPGGSPLVQVLVPHFSDLVVSVDRGESVQILAPATAQVGTQWQATAIVRWPNDRFDIQRVAPDRTRNSAPRSLRYTGRALRGSFGITEGVATRASADDSAIAVPFKDSVTASATFSCVRAGRATVSYIYEGSFTPELDGTPMPPAKTQGVVQASVQCQ